MTTLFQQQLRLQRHYERPTAPWTPEPSTDAGGGRSKLPPGVVCNANEHPDDDPWWEAWLLYADAMLHGTSLTGGAPEYDRAAVQGRSAVPNEAVDGCAVQSGNSAESAVSPGMGPQPLTGG
jgi:hypothetical protein